MGAVQPQLQQSEGREREQIGDQMMIDRRPGREDNRQPEGQRHGLGAGLQPPGHEVDQNRCCRSRQQHANARRQPGLSKDLEKERDPVERHRPYELEEITIGKLSVVDPCGIGQAPAFIHA
jgi:hypothetical protein